MPQSVIDRLDTASGQAIASGAGHPRRGRVKIS